jgi:hypothetical protein
VQAATRLEQQPPVITKGRFAGRFQTPFSALESRFCEALESASGSLEKSLKKPIYSIA